LDRTSRRGLAGNDGDVVIGELPRIEYPLAVSEWRTPNGAPIRFAYRENTNDWNTINSCMFENDEYLLRGRPIEGDAVDVGGYLGSVGVTIAVDNPMARVLIVEPVPDNADLIRQNADMNGVGDRVTVFEGAVGKTGQKTSEIRFRYVGDANLEHHAFVGNTSLAYDTGGDTPHETLDVETLGVAELLNRFGIAEPVFLKIDCEGGEWAFLDAPARDLRRLPYIIGEAHPVRGHSAKDIHALLDKTHSVTLSGPNQDPGPCGFVAVRR
jgi:FkbM family methyltransferase